MSAQPLFGAEPDKLRSIRPRDMAIRFAFGAGLSVVAAVLGETVGPLVGGMFLAFPAILPAALTLIEKREGESEARDDDVGALLGAVALVAFAVVAWRLMPANAPLALLAAAVAWLGGAVLLYLLTRWAGRRRAKR